MNQVRFHKHLLFFIIAGVLAILLVSVTFAAPQMGGDYELFRASVGTGNVEGNGSSFHAYSSYDGRYVAFESYAQNWAIDSTGGMLNYADIFVRDIVTEQTTKLSIGMDGETGSDKSFFPSVSADGRYIAYISYSNNLVPGDTNGDNPWENDGLDVFLYDQMFGSTSRISLNYAGQQIDGGSVGVLSPSGRYLVFFSSAPNVVNPSPPEGITRLYIRDWQNNTISLISKSINGQDFDPDGLLHQVALDYDANYIAFSSDYDNLAPNDQNGIQDVFLYNRATNQTILVSKNAAGFSGNGISGRPQISPGGEYLVFSSIASDLVTGDTNNYYDIFLYEIATGNIRRINLTPNGMEANGDNKEPSICEDGRYIAWTSGANNYTPLDINTYNDVFFYDTVQDEIRLVSVDMNGYSPNGAAHRSWLSPDCRYVVFASESDNMIIGDTNEERDLYMGRLIWPFDLSPSTQGGPAFADPGETLTYKVWVRNLGLESGTASFKSSIPDHTTYLSGSGTNGAVYNSATNEVQWTGTLMGESEELVSFSVLVSPGLTETVFLPMETQITGDNIGYTLESVTIVNGYYALLPGVYK